MRTGAEKSLPALYLMFILLVLTGCQAKSTTKNSNGGGTEQGSGGVAGGLSAEDLVRAVELKSRGIGHLENKEWPEAEAELTELAILLPGNRVAARNLAIERVLSILDRESPFSRSQDIAAYVAAMDRARAAIETLRAASAEDTALCDLMLGKLLVHDDSPDKPSIAEGIALLQKATSASGDQPDYWFALALAMDGHRDYGDSPDLIEVLQKCFTLAPENLFVAQKLLERQALGLNSANPATKQLALGIVDTLKAASQLIAPMNGAILKQRRVNLVETIGKAIDAFDGKNPNTLMGPAMMTKNLLLPELATQIDKRRIDKNLLEFVLVDFDEDIVARLRENGILPKPVATVISGFQPGPQLPNIPAIRQLEFQDMDLDGVDDLVVNSDGRIQVYTRSRSAGDWSLLLETPVDAGAFDGFLLADIDRDFDRALADVKSPAKLLDRDGDRKIVTDPAQQNRWFDTDLDLIAWNAGSMTVFRNMASSEGVRTLEMLPQAATPENVRQVVAADLEADGDLDLIAATATGLTVLRNVDGSTFDLVVDGIHGPDYAIDGLAIGDWNRDMAMDLVGVSAAGNAGTLQNMLHNRFRWLVGVDGIHGTPASTHCRIGDFDGNLSWDLLTAGPSGIHATMTSTSADGAMSLLKNQEITRTATSHVNLVDVDNDGFSDIVAVTAGHLMMFRGLPDGTFEDVSKLVPQGLAVSEFTTADIDDDGDMDIIYVSNEGATLSTLLNEGGNVNGWLDVVVRPVADDPQFPSNRVNMHSLGSVMELRTGAHFQAHIINKPRMHLGMGAAQQADALRIIWTDGVPQDIVVRDLLKTRIGIMAPQILKGSCPYIYTWTGDRFEFFSDCLWAAPIGLVQASGDLAPTREWEYLLIPGEQLAAKDGRYVLQLTEELWEAAYFDEVKLMAVDHPAEVSIFTNEKVGSPQMAAHRVHTVRNRQLPATVVDGRGGDLLPGLRAQDGNYVQAFSRRIMQGLTDEWVMEFDPGLQARPTNLRLVLIGWVFPTDTSLNVGIQQNPAISPPAPPSLEVRDAAGNWTVARPFIGFPSGKTKAMVVDLSDAFVTDDLRFRLKSSMELYWDTAFFIVDEQDAETITYDCSLAAADLHYRGFSRRTYADNALFRNGHAPEGYDYESVTMQPRWPALMGRFTRYGDATLLVEQADDQMVVMGPGDELTMEFNVPAEVVPQGWKRDFVLYNVGWDKDADLNTVYGQSSEPYPFRSMSQYPITPDESEPSSESYQSYLNEWQTREWKAREFWSAGKRVSNKGNP